MRTRNTRDEKLAGRARYIFVCGLHRTGTSLVTKLLSHHPDIATISGAPVPEQEGAFLQGAIPHDATHGVPGEYATDPAQHLIEGSRYDTTATRERLEADWRPWFDETKVWRLEKSPVNLTRMRLYQQLFPLAHFIVVLRHPEKMAAALAKWSDREADKLIDYGLDAYTLALEDMARLHHHYLLRYEDLVFDPGGQLDAITAWLGTSKVTPCLEIRDGNADYANAQTMTDSQSDRAASFGYRRRGTLELPPRVGHLLRERREAAIAALQKARGRMTGHGNRAFPKGPASARVNG